MIRLVTTSWLVLGAALGAAYFSPPVQRLVRQSDAREPSRAAYEARARAMKLAGTARTPAVQAAMAAEWGTAREAADAALRALSDSSGKTKLMLRILRAEAMAQTGHAEQAIGDLEDLEQLVAHDADPDRSEAVHAALAQANYQVALMIREEASDAGDWIKNAEIACSLYQDLLKTARDEAAAVAYRKDLACVTRFLFGTPTDSACLAMPPVRTVDCKKKMRRLERERSGSRARPRYVPPPADEADRLRQEQIKRTRQGEDDGK
jgi:hypothetical protein